MASETKKWLARALPQFTLFAAACTTQSAHAVDFDTGDPDLKVRWDNTFRYSTAARVKERDARVSGGAATGRYAGAPNRDINADDADRNFSRGIISNRIDLFSELDISYQDVGFRMSAAAWYDGVYNKSNGNDSPATVNRLSPGAYNEFLPGTRKQHGRKAEVLDAFAFGKYQLGEASGSFRAGRYAQIWGESLFFGGNGIAGGMAPVDITKLQSVPTSTSKETTMPVGQVGTQVTVAPGVSVGGYYQFEWRGNRFPGVGSYFSTTDMLFAGAEVGYFGPFRNPHSVVEAKNSGQFGLRLRYTPQDWNTEFGVYALRYHDKAPRTYLTVAPQPVGAWREVYHEGIRAFGASFSTSVGDAAVAGEASIRDNAPLVSLSQSAVAGFNNADRPGYAIGRTAHANLNVFYLLPRAAFWDAGSFLAEIAWNRRLSVDKNAGAIDPNTTRDAASTRVVFAPQWLNAQPGLDVSLPFGLGYTFKGNRSSAVSGFGVDGGGDFSVGLNLLYEQVWDVRLNYVSYFGNPGPSSINGSATYLQALRDRNFVSLSLQRAF